jgi:organic radical activating enzyme
MHMNKFCRYLSNGNHYKLEYDNTVSFAPCCHFPERVPLDSIPEFRQKINNITDWTPACSSCQRTESLSTDLGHVSTRIRSFSDITEDSDAYLELQLDITCNGGCVICGPWLSTFWQQHARKFDIHNISDNKIRIAANNVAEVLQTVDLQKCRRILFTGGEALLSSIDLEVIRQIKDKSNLVLHYVSNGSVYPSAERIGFWAECKFVTIILSVDATAQQFEYNRYPLKWDQVQANILRMRAELPDNVRFRINHTTTPMSILYSDRFFSWLEKNLPTNRAGVEVTVNFHSAHGVWNINAMHPDLKRLVLEKYPASSMVHKVALTSEYDPGSHRKLLEFASKWDKHRNLYWQQVFPDIVPYMQLN